MEQDIMKNWHESVIEASKNKKLQKRAEEGFIYLRKYGFIPSEKYFDYLKRIGEKRF